MFDLCGLSCYNIHMNRSKFTFNAFILVFILFASALFFFVITLSDLDVRYAANDSYPIEGTDLFVRYSNKKENGIYEGQGGSEELRVAGDFGHDWGMTREGNVLYANEYRTSSLGLMFCDLVKIDLETFEKTVISENTTLRGRCASGELVCVGGTLMDSAFPSTNPLCRLYAMSEPKLELTGHGAVVLFVDPVKGEGVYAEAFNKAGDFESRYMDKTLAEVMK